MAAQTQIVQSFQAQAHAAPKYNRKEAAEYLGLSVDGLITMMRQGRGPASYKIGRSVRFSLADLVAFAESHRRPA